MVVVVVGELGVCVLCVCEGFRRQLCVDGPDRRLPASRQPATTWPLLCNTRESDCNDSEPRQCL